MSLTQEQKALRLTGIGGSEIAAVLGLSPWARPIDVWRAKVMGMEVEETLPMRRGRILEPAICSWYAEDYGAKLRECGTLRHPSSRVLLATPDRLATLPTGEERVLEAKSANFRMLDRWGQDGTDEVPEYYLVQVASEMGCAKLPAADLAVLIAGDDFRVYHLHRDLELESMLLECAERFWTDYVITKREPAPDASESYGEWLKEKYKEPKGGFIAAPAQAAPYARQLHAARHAKSVAEKMEQDARQNLEALIGNAEGMEGDGWRISWKMTKGKAAVNWEAVVQELGIPKATLDKHTKRSPFRTFRPTFAGDRDE